ncbi:MAG: hypothetical protein A2Z21_06350 [Candidatus Fraserbacteria bacterium RBG_16_55_9]|uniref:Alginate O-acetyltransferase n=1 Tax=Fraserbacteria sp. (strain RBG_16_55_9) TaxID=1817864 RepID=A0A1F5UZZ8_FRAXR|nr:MAG: hypothetical protein A2Z21_06350 [Candidatus Fraserbacteria bacterium RBG_16_55_9]
MLPNSLTFLVSLAGLVLAYYLFPHRFRWPLLLLASYYFYVSWEPGPTLLLIGLTLITYFMALGIGKNTPRKKLLLVLGVLLNVSLQVLFKYFDFFMGEMETLMRGFGLTLAFPKLGLPLPVGLSFYTFSIISYLVDVYRGKVEPERHIGRLAVYIAFFPKILAGPIERAVTFLPQLRERIHFNPERMIEGSQLILWGLFKKVVIADRLAPFVNAAFENPTYTPTIQLIIASYFFAFQIYCDFSGYTDIARGTGKLFGFDIMENFRRAYLSKSAAEFWGSRWHISLATWFRDYMYIPMGGSRVSHPRHYFNLMAVFIVSGWWHAGLGFGVNWAFLIWGGLNGFYQWVSVGTAGIWRKLAELLPWIKDRGIVNVVRILLTFHLITFAWIFFRANSISDAWTVITRIYKGWNLLPLMFETYAYTPEFLIAIASIILLMIVEVLDERLPMWERLRTKPAFVRWPVYYALIFILLTLGKWGGEQFIYMQF